MMCDYVDERLLHKTALSIRALDKAERALEKARCLMPCDSYDRAVTVVLMLQFRWSLEGGFYTAMMLAVV